MEFGILCVGVIVGIMLLIAWIQDQVLSQKQENLPQVIPEDIREHYILIRIIFKIMESMKYVQVGNSHLRKELLSIVEEASHLQV